LNHFGSYEVLCALKSGGMGDILLGRRKGPGSFEQMVAIKTIRSQLSGAELVRAHFLDEAAILAKVNHGAVAAVHDFGEQDGTLYMVMEYVAGISFRDLLDMKPPATVIVQAVAEACRGLHAAHELKDLDGNAMGVVHRDISPDNLILGFDGHVKVIDFGIALIKNRQAPATEFGSLKGKPAYMSPEQLKNASVDRRADVFAIAVVLWELLTGRALFEGDSLYAIAYAVDNQAIVPPSQLAGALPAGLDAAVLGALARDADNRTRSAAALAEQLTEIANSSGEASLEAWAEENLAAHRDDHRKWLSKVMNSAAKSASADQPLQKGPLQRGITPNVTSDTGPGASSAFAKTEFGDPANSQTNASQQPTRLPNVATDASMHIVAASKRSPRWLPMAAATALLGLASVGGYLVIRPKSGPLAPVVVVADVTAIDAAVVAPPIVPLSVVDARPPDDAAPPTDAAKMAEQAPARKLKPDRATPPRPPTQLPTAPGTTATVPPVPVPTGTGTLRIKSSKFANVTLDDKSVGDAPFKKNFAAGTYKLKVIAPDTGEVTVAKTVTITDGQETLIVVP
jgi:eukaryotic-like serine/threonine-protein kinase